MRYEWVTNEMFDRALGECLVEEVERNGAASLLQIPGAYEVFSEHFNNEALERLETEREMDEEDDE